MGLGARLTLTLLALALLALALLAATGCGDRAGGTRSGEGGGAPTPDGSVAISYYGGEGDHHRAEIVCGADRDEVRGFLRLEQPADACRRLTELAPFLTAPPPRDRVCAQVFAGPERARFTGRFGGRRVDRRFTRTDACEVKDWERVRAFLPKPR
jgi:hypothetical protein